MSAARRKAAGAASPAREPKAANGDVIVDLGAIEVRELNRRLHALAGHGDNRRWRIVHPEGRHSVCVGLDAPLEIMIEGPVGYYCAGMNKQARITIDGQAGKGVAENMMSGEVRVKGNASDCAGATAHGGLLVIEGDAGARCGISMKGVDIVVKGSVGHLSGFMAQKGHLVVCGDAGHSLGDSIYEAVLYVKGRVAELGADCIEKKMTPDHAKTLKRLLDRAGIKADPGAFRRYGSARKLYNFHVDHADAY